MAAKKILLVNGNPTDAQALQSDLTRAGYNVLRAADTTSALTRIDQQAPDLILSEVKLKNGGGIELCWHIRSASKHPLIPFVILTAIDDEEVRLNAYRSGVDFFLLKPVSIRNLSVRIDALITRYQKMRGYFSLICRSFSGSLRDIQLIDLIQLFNMNQKTGSLWLSKGFSRGVVFFNHGEIDYAKMEKSEGEKAVYEMADWNDGFFDFEAQGAKFEKNVTTSTMKLLLECSKKQDEAALRQLNEYSPA